MSLVSTSSDNARYLGIGILGLVVGGVAALLIDGVPDMALPAVAMLVLAIALYIENET